MDIEIPKECQVPILQSSSNLVPNLLSKKPHNYYGSDGNDNKTDDISDRTHAVESYEVGHTLQWTYSTLNPSVITSEGHADDVDGQSHLSPASTEVNVHPSESVPAQSAMTRGYPRELTSFRIVTEPIAPEMRHRSTDGVVVVTSVVSEVVGEVASTTLVPSTAHDDVEHVGRGTLERPHGNVFAEEGNVIMKKSYAEAISFGFLAFVIPVILAAIVLLIWYRRYTADPVHISVTASGTIAERSRSEINRN
jgi:hypothetical protein